MAVVHPPQPPPWPPDSVAPAPLIAVERMTNKRKATEISAAEYMLGKLALFYARELRSKGWRKLVCETRGLSHITPTARLLPHKAARLLEHLGKRGAGVTMHTSHWSPVRKRQALARGPHKSFHGEREFVSEEMLDFCHQGYWIVLPQDAVLDWPNIRISPLGGVVPQRDRRPRLIVDYSFSDVNAETIPLAPSEAMLTYRSSGLLCPPLLVPFCWLHSLWPFPWDGSFHPHILLPLPKRPATSQTLPSERAPCLLGSRRFTG